MPARQAQGRRVDSEFNYNLARWKKDRRNHLIANPLCVRCLESGIRTDATVSDHIDPIRQGGDPWCWSNRQALCDTCHNIKSGREAHTRRPRGRGV